MKRFAMFVLISGFALSGCATILNDDTQQVNVSSSTGSEITGTVDGMPFKAPGIVRLTRENKDKIFITETEGCSKQVVAPKTVDLKFFINVLSGGAFGSTTDFATANMWKYSDNIVIPCKN